MINCDLLRIGKVTRLKTGLYLDYTELGLLSNDKLMIQKLDDDVKTSHSD